MKNIAAIKNFKNHTPNKMKEIEIKNMEYNYLSGDINKVYEVNKESQQSKLSRSGILIIRNFPYFFWFLGFVIIFIGILLFINILLGLDKENPKKIINTFNKGYWWEYFIVAVIIAIGVSIMAIARFEKIYINKDENSFIISKNYFFCWKVRSLEIELSNIESIFAYKTGRVSNTNNSVVYKLGIRFKEGEKSLCIYVFKSIFEKFVIEDVKTLKEFVFNTVEHYDIIKDEIRNGIHNTRMDYI